jgi:nucleotide-binding universal stress UspA family protein
MSAGIVVGIEGTPAGRAALEWAFREGRLRVAPVTVVHAWGQPVGRDAMKMSEPEARRASACMLVAAVAEAQRAVGGKPTVVERSRRGSAAKVLLAEAAYAEMLVLGRTHHRGVVDVMGQSVSAECVRHASCPVVIIPGAPAVPPTLDLTDAAAIAAASLD